MFSNIEELKEFIIWAKKEQLQVIKVGDVEIHVSPQGLMPEAYDQPQGQMLTEDILDIQEQAQKDEQDSQDTDEELLYHSVT